VIDIDKNSCVIDINRDSYDDFSVIIIIIIAILFSYYSNLIRKFS